MIKGLRNILALTGACVLTIASLAGCGSTPADGQGTGSQVQSGQTSDNQARPSETSQAEGSQSQLSVGSSAVGGQELSGTLQMAGSTSMEKLSNALAEAFMDKYTSITVTSEFVGSSAGVEAVLSGSADIGNSSRKLKDEEKEKGAVENIVAIDGIAVCVDSANTVTGLTKQQLTDIYTGEIVNWSEVGGADAPVIVVGREAGSGTRGAFEELLGIEDSCAYANELDSTGACLAKVASTPGAIGYVSLDALDDSVTALALEGVEATAENIKAGSYILSRPFVMATKGTISEQNEIVQAWFEFVLGKEGQAVAADTGLITIE